MIPYTGAYIDTSSNINSNGYAYSSQCVNSPYTLISPSKNTEIIKPKSDDKGLIFKKDIKFKL